MNKSRKKLNHLIRVLSFVILFTNSCTPLNGVIEHEKPDLRVDYSFFEELGCFSANGCPISIPDNTWMDSVWLEKPPEYLGGLSPSIPIAKALTFDFDHDPNIPSIYFGRCAATVYTNYMVHLNGQIEMLDSREEFAQVFAPVESAEEALSYAVAVTGYTPMYDLETIEGIEIASRMLEETYIKRVIGGYRVHLFDYFLCHCGPFTIQSVEVTVFRNGTVRISKGKDAFHDPQLDNVCFD